MVELLAAWGAPADPRHDDIVACISQIRQELSAPGRNTYALLSALHTRHSDLLPTEFDRAIGEALSLLEAGKGPVPRSLRTRLEGLASRASSILVERIGPLRAALVGEVRGIVPHLENDAADEILRLLWSTESTGSVGGHLETLGRFDALRKRLDTARRERQETLRTLIAECERNGVPEARLGPARIVWQRADPMEIAVAIGDLQDFRDTEEHARRLAALVKSRSALAVLRDQAREVGSSAAPPEGAPPRTLLAEAVSGATAGIDTASRAATPAEVSAAESVLAVWDRLLRSLLESPAGSSAEGSRERKEAAAALIVDLERVRTRIGDSKEPHPVGARLREAAPAGGHQFQEAVLDAIDARLKLAVQEEARSHGAVEKLRSCKNQLTSLLERNAKLLPASRLFEAVTLTEDAEDVLSSGNFERVASLNQSIERAIEAIGKLAAEVRGGLRKRDEDVRETMIRNAARLAEIASGRTARRLETAVSKLRRSEAGKLEDFGNEIRRIETRIERRIGGRAGRALRRAGSKRFGAGARRVPELGVHAESLRSALRADDLRAIQERTSELERSLRRASILLRPLVRALLVVVPAVVIVASWIIWSHLRSAPRSYTLVFDPKPASGRSCKVELMPSDGSDSVSGILDAEGRVDVSIRPGNYEVFVDGRFIGKRITVPDDPGRVEHLPLPGPAD